MIVNEQQKYFSELTKHTHPEEIKIALNYYDSKLGAYKPGKRYNSNKFELHDERNVAINEIIFDFDWKSYKANYKEAKKVIEALENLSVPYMICDTGGKGIHIHTFFNKLEFSNDKQKELFKTALSYNFSYKHIRLWFWNKILDYAGIDERYRGKGKQVDSAPMIFNYYNGTTHLIRDIGGRKYSSSDDTDFKIAYKTYIPKDEFKGQKKLISRIEDVRYPETIPKFNIDTADLSEMLTEYIKKAEITGQEKLKHTRFEGQYTELDGVLKIREGLGEGQRSAGACIISIAAKLDDLSKKRTTQIIEEYVNNCDHVGSVFTIEEGKQWMEWIYGHEKPFWNCQLLEDIGVHDKSTCNFCQNKNKEALKILTNSNILDKIKEVLDVEIMGEDHTKMLIFLLSLSKDFPSKTGTPGWNIPGDPMSQNIILSSDSSSGKTYITKKILELIGDEGQDYYVISRITKSALNYYTDINMDRKVIFIEELQGLDEHTAQLRVWMSEGALNLSTVEKIKMSDGTEQNVEIKKTTTGQPVFISNQAESIVETQLNNRSWVISTDTSTDQTKHILNFQDIVNTGNFESDSVKKRNLKDAIKLLKPYHFIIPYANNEFLNIPVNDVRSRRDYQKFLTLIKCSAYLHQQQRLIYKDDKGQEYLICNLEDYEIAKKYSQDILGATFSGLTNAQIDLINYVRKENWVDGFEINYLMRSLGKSQTHWYGMLKQLVDIGFFTEDKNNGKSTIYHLVTERAINIINLPGKDEVLQKWASKNEGPKSKLFVSAENFMFCNESVSEKTLEKIGEFEKLLLGEVSKPSNLIDRGMCDLKVDLQNNNIGKTIQTQENGIFLHSSYNAQKKLGPQEGIKELRIYDFIKNNDNHIVSHDEIQEEFKEQEITEEVKTLLISGNIMEIKPGKYMVLQ